MPHRYPPEMRRQAVELARSGTRAKRFAATLAVSEATIYNWIKQEKIDCGEIVGLNTEEALELATAKRSASSRRSWRWPGRPTRFS